MEDEKQHFYDLGFKMGKQQFNVTSFLNGMTLAFVIGTIMALLI